MALILKGGSAGGILVLIRYLMAGYHIYTTTSGAEHRTHHMSTEGAQVPLAFKLLALSGFLHVYSHYFVITPIELIKQFFFALQRFVKIALLNVSESAN